MLLHPTLDKLQQLRLNGMLTALQEQTSLTEIDALSFEERLGLLVDRELTERENRRLARRLRSAKLRQSASVEDIDYQQPRGLDRALMTRLAEGTYLRAGHNVIITGPTGVGKSYLACALAHRACLSGHTAKYLRLPRLIEELHIARLDGSYPKLLARLAKTSLIVLDDWGLLRLNPEQQRDLLEVIDDRHQRHSTLLTSQLSVDQWHETMTDPTLADAILDRLVHSAYRIELRGESMRKNAANLEEGFQAP